MHLALWPNIDQEWNDPSVADRFQPMLVARSQINEAIEPLRREKIVRSSLEANVIYPAISLDQQMPGGAKMDAVALAEFAIVANVTFGDTLEISRTANHKCGRCWRHLPEVVEDGDLCKRCEDVVHAS